MGNSFRMQPGPTLYSELKTPVTEDLLEVGLLVAFGIIAFSFILIIPGIRGAERIWATMRVLGALWIGAVIMVSNFSYGWYEGKVSVKTQYRAYTDEQITADVGLFIGLRGLNITLKGDPIDPNGELAGEIIDYNEQFWWANPWRQGRPGYGRFAQRFNQEYRAGQYRGMPYPILWVAEKFTADGGQMRWCRLFRQAGWFTHIFLWLSFAVYLLDVVVFIFDIAYGAYLMVILGFCMILACLSFGLIIINETELVFPWTLPDCDGATQDCTIFLDPEFGWCFYLVLATGIAVVVFGVLIYVLHYFYPRHVASFFHHSVIEDDEIFLQEVPPAEQTPKDTESYGIPSHAGSLRRGIAQYRRAQRKSKRLSREDSNVSRRSDVLSRGLSILSRKSSQYGEPFKEEVELEEVPVQNGV